MKNPAKYYPKVDPCVWGLLWCPPLNPEDWRKASV